LDGEGENDSKAGGQGAQRADAIYLAREESSQETGRYAGEG